MDIALKEIKTGEEFFLETPLYTSADASLETIKIIFGSAFRGTLKMDGHCPECSQPTTFTAETVYNSPGQLSQNLINYGLTGIYQFTFACARVGAHKLQFFVEFDKGSAQKMGQLPSLADIANDESKVYRSVLEKEDSAELHMAIGLAAHAVGIGSYVYLRRIFERLITRRFDEVKSREGWTDEEFTALRMVERVRKLKNDLPPFLVENAEIYSILSVGIHALDEDTCRQQFGILKESIVMILDEDRQRKEKREREKLLKKAIKDFKNPAQTSTRKPE